MKKITLRFIIFSFVSFLVLNLVCAGLIHYGLIDFQYGYLYDVIARRHTKLKGRVLYLGDSVGRQLFKNVEGALPTNMNVLMAGQYILMHDALEANPQIEHVVYIGVPTSIGKDLEGEGVYSFFLEPFFNYKNLVHFSPEIYEKMNEKPQTYLSFLPFWKSAKFVSDVRLPSKKGQKVGTMPILSSIYIKKMAELAEIKNVKLHFVCPPLKKDYPAKYNDWAGLKEYTKKSLNNEFQEYWKNITFYPDSCFSDYAHFTHEFLEREQENICKEILPPEIQRQLVFND